LLTWTIAATVGWLDAEHPFTRGDVSSEFLQRLVEFANQSYASDISLSDVATLGAHACELCADAIDAGRDLVTHPPWQSSPPTG
jgi:hypothetical protein